SDRPRYPLPWRTHPESERSISVAGRYGGTLLLLVSAFDVRKLHLDVENHLARLGSARQHEGIDAAPEMLSYRLEVDSPGRHVTRALLIDGVRLERNGRHGHVIDCSHIHVLPRPSAQR